MYPSIATLSPSPERLTVLFSPFRARSLNPDHYDQKMRFWQSVVKEFCEIEHKLSLTQNGVEQQIMAQCGGKSPSCLEEVFAAMIRDGTLVRYDDYLASLSLQANSSSWVAWSAQNAKKLALRVWSLNGFNPFAVDWSRLYGSKTEVANKFIFIPQMTSIIERATSLPELTQVKSLEDLKKAISLETGLSDEDIELVVKHLKAIGRLATDNLPDECEVAKILPTPNSPGITQVERGKFDVRRKIEALDKQLNQVTEKRDQAHNLAKVALKAGKRYAAKSHLRARNAQEKRIEKLNSALDTLSALEIQIETAESDAKVVNAFEVGKKTLDHVFKDNNLTADRVTEVLLDVQELLEEGADISSAISQPIDNEDMSLIEQELDALMKEQEKPSKANEDAELKKMLDGLTINDEALSPHWEEHAAAVASNPKATIEAEAAL